MKFRKIYHKENQYTNPNAEFSLLIRIECMSYLKLISFCQMTHFITCKMKETVRYIAHEFMKK